ncbi:hypothetical protein GCM10022236_41510 [Microlunatus ginsengisoli]|uniref:Uncharacterized protein n=1 Tax=Microlunatus ginsengisoli TaxID=363863 RepID=A0ABP7ALJ2_9ACTN
MRQIARLGFESGERDQKANKMRDRPVGGEETESERRAAVGTTGATTAQGPPAGRVSSVQGSGRRRELGVVRLQGRHHPIVHSGPDPRPIKVVREAGGGTLPATIRPICRLAAAQRFR